MDENTEKRMDDLEKRISSLEHFAFVGWFKIMSKEGAVSDEAKRKVSEYFGYNWDATAELLMEMFSAEKEVLQ